MPLESMHHPHPDIAPNADRSADPITDPITDLSADALSQAIHARSLSCREVMQAYLNRIHRLNPALNAIVNLAQPEPLLAQAEIEEHTSDSSHPRLSRMPSSA